MNKLNLKKLWIILPVWMTFFMVSCGNAAKNNESTSETESATVKNLKAAIDGETGAQAKYAAFARQAAAEGYAEVAALFEATSMAEGIHIRNHQAVLASMGVTDYVGAKPEFTVGTTAENLKTAINGETYEFSTMYPEFIAAAEKESNQGAVVSFNYAQDSEKGHARLYTEALAKLEQKGAFATVYYVCPKCGNAYAGTPDEICTLCQTSKEKFLTFPAAK